VALRREHGAQRTGSPSRRHFASQLGDPGLSADLHLAESTVRGSIGDHRLLSREEGSSEARGRRVILGPA
jgi:hypothetical protein